MVARADRRRAKSVIMQQTNGHLKADGFRHGCTG